MGRFTKRKQNFNIEMQNNQYVKIAMNLFNKDTLICLICRVKYIGKKTKIIQSILFFNRRNFRK